MHEDDPLTELPAQYVTEEVLDLVCGKTDSFGQEVLGCTIRDEEDGTAFAVIGPNVPYQKCIISHERKHIQGWTHGTRLIRRAECG